MGGAGGGGGRGSRAIRLLLLLVLALAAVEYLFGGILDASPLKTYLHTPIYNASQPQTGSQISRTTRNGDKSQSIWPKFTSDNSESKDLLYTNINSSHILNIFTNNVKSNVTQKTKANASKNETENSNITMRSVQTFAYNGTSSFISKLKNGIKKLKTEAPLPLCPKMPPDLGPVSVNKTDLELDFVEKKFPEIQLGGRYSPPNCTALHKVAIIVPFRDRQQHLAVFLNHMHPFLMKQQIEYGIFIVEQEGKKDFNRAKLMNVGFVESQRLASGWGCFVFHDIDLLPLDTRNLYSCPRQPRHMSASIDKLKNKLPYADIFGGVSAVTLEQFTKVNGFSNKYWGWGGEDDDMAYRLKKMKYHVSRYKMSIARYAMLDHKKSVPNPQRYKLLSQTNTIFQKDGLSTLHYQTLSVVQYHLYTYILANIDEDS